MDRHCLWEGASPVGNDSSQPCPNSKDTCPRCPGSAGAGKPRPALSGTGGGAHVCCEQGPPRDPTARSRSCQALRRLQANPRAGGQLSQAVPPSLPEGRNGDPQSAGVCPEGGRFPQRSLPPTRCSVPLKNKFRSRRGGWLSMHTLRYSVET